MGTSNACASDDDTSGWMFPTRIPNTHRRTVSKDGVDDPVNWRALAASWVIDG